MQADYISLSVRVEIHPHPKGTFSVVLDNYVHGTYEAMERAREVAEEFSGRS